MELFCGDGDTPDLKCLVLIERFFDSSVDHIRAIRRSAFKIPMFWRPIRFAVNNEGRLGIQFRLRLTGRQEGMFFADEHSSFTTRLTDVTITEADFDRLKQRGMAAS
jgi:hypothetical protein